MPAVGRALVDDDASGVKAREGGVGVAGPRARRGSARTVAGSRGRCWMRGGVVMASTTLRPPGPGGSSAGPSPGERVHTAGMLAIGEFSRLTHLSVRTLRRYHDADLLEPAAVDDATGYRYYSAEQIPTAQVIHRLRELDVPLPTCGASCAPPTRGARADLVGRPPAPARVGAGPDPGRGRVAAPAAGARSRPRWTWSCAPCRRRRWRRSRTDVALDDVLAGTPAPWPSWTRSSASRPVPPAGLYDNALFEDGRGHVLVYRPTDRPPRRRTGATR